MAETKEIEVLKKALLLERQGRAFYQRVSQDTESRAVSSLFTVMAEEEGKKGNLPVAESFHVRGLGILENIKELIGGLTV